jgi:hypothetical protein
MKNITLFRITAASLALMSAAVAQASVLIIGAPGTSSWNDDVQAKIAGTGLISGSVDVFNAAAGTPSLALLQSYSSVLFYSDTSFNDPIALGNTLADYVDAGGGVVQAVFSFHASGIDIGGRWRSGSYDVWAPGSQNENTPLTLGTIHQPGSAILTGVTSFSGGSSSYYNTVGALNPGAVAVADWSNGESLIAENLTSFNGRIVGLNFYPPSSDVRNDFWNASTDGALIMANALNHVGNGTPSTSVPDGGSMLAMLGVALAALGLIRRKLG